MAQTKIKLHAQKLEGERLFFDHQNNLRLREFEAQLPPGCYEYTIEKARKDKSHKQVKAIFGLLINSIIAEANQWGIDTRQFLNLLVQTDMPSGIGLTKDFLYQLFLTVCPVTDDDGRRVTLSKMSTVQAAKFLDECRNLVSTTVGIYIPDPNPNWKSERG